MRVQLVAHRGDPSRFPENTLASLAGAIQSGARWLEFDVQLSADAVPVLLHDAELSRLTGAPGRVMDLAWERLGELPVRRPEGRARGENSEKIPSLAEAASWLASQPGIFAFVEMKQESLEYFGREACLTRILPPLTPLAGRFALISFDAEFLFIAKQRGIAPLGWVLAACGGAQRRSAESLRPEFLFCDRRLLGRRRRPPWPGSWSWILYTVDDVRSAVSWQRRGFSFIETNRIAALLAAPELADQSVEPSPGSLPLE